MNEIDVDIRDESVLRFVLSLPTDADGTRLRVNGKALFRVIPVLPSDSKAEHGWTDEQNARRCLLIDKVSERAAGPTARPRWVSRRQFGGIL